MSTFQPLHDQVLVRVQKAADEKRTATGIIIQNANADQPLRATVVAVGPGVMVSAGFFATTVKPGDVVLVPRYNGTPLTLDEVDYVVFREGQMLGTLTETPAALGVAEVA